VWLCGPQDFSDVAPDAPWPGAGRLPMRASKPRGSIDKKIS
jgi:hypothetical protein